MPIIKFQDAWEMYRIKFIIEGKASWQNFWALRGVSFSMEKGETLGIIGENGAGKSTVLKLIAGMLNPDRGQVNVSGRVAGLLELGAGFQPELTGRENIFLQSELFGLSREEIDKGHRKIVDFAEIGKFIDAPVKCYSQGMFVRLAFAIAIHMDPDIFLIDDTLSVGDEYFQKKCIKEIFKLKESGKTVVIVTHDLALLQKLCKRAIFLKNGMMVSDGNASKTTSFYSQALGSPKGSAIIRKKDLSLVFNNGRVLLNWKGNQITAPSGIYTAFGLSGRWYNSSQAEWELRDTAGMLMATGKFPHLGLTQIWSLRVSDDNEISWDMEIEPEKEAPLPEVYFNAFLDKGYNKWVLDQDAGDFPDIKEEDKSWMPVFSKNGTAVCIGVYQQDSASGELPVLLFENPPLKYPVQGSISNSDYFNPGRILQFKAVPLIAAVPDQTGRISCFSGKIIVGIGDINGHISRMQNESAISNGRLKLAFDKGRIRLFFDNIPLTKAEHMHSAFFAQQRWHSSDSGRWKLEKESESKMTARGSWDNFGIRQIWQINICDDSSFTWDVDLEVDRDTAIQQQRLRCFFPGDFKLFFSEFASGEFSDKFTDREVDLLQRCVWLGPAELSDRAGKLPRVSLFFSEKLDNFVKVFNSDFYSKARLLHVEKVEPEENMVFSPGRHECFKARFVFGKNNTVRADIFDNTIENKDIKLVFDKGSGRFYKNGSELTKNIALYTSIRSQKRWHDSFSAAIWKVVYNDGKKLRIFGRWLDLPLSQEWEILLRDNGIFSWQVVLGVEKEITLDCLQANIMSSERFSRWIGGREEGAFPEFSGETDDSWDCLWRGKEDDRVIGLREDPARNLPGLSLRLQESNPQWRLKIMNSDIYHRGRILQYASSSKINFLPGKYPYFSGILAIQDT
ncbi:MAG: ABC transporter ATP-binding protein [Candidatus Omnitrophica bacterium]|nr:ABC transporter ATP-binding protein [Candidatus Omnitrophota bacterium]